MLFDDGDCRMTVYMNGSEKTVSCAPKERMGRMLLAGVPELAPVGAAVKILCSDSLYLGEVWACWSAEDDVLVMVELTEVLHFSEKPRSVSGMA